MLKLISARKRSRKLKSGENMHYIPLSEMPYTELKADFSVAAHLAAIDELDLQGAGGVLIKCHCIEDGLLAASYLYKKYESLCAPTHSANMEDVFDDEEYPTDDEEDQEEEEEEEEEGSEDIESLLYSDDRIAHLPVIPSGEFANAFVKQPPFSAGFGLLNTRWEGEVRTSEPYWLHGAYPLVVEDRNGSSMHYKEAFEHFEQNRRFLIYVSEYHSLLRDYSTDSINHFEKALLFETNLAYCLLEKPTTEYYEHVLTDMIKARGYKISKKVNKTKLVKALMDYRGMSFRSSVDIDTFVNKAINKMRGESRTMKEADFEQIFVARELHKKAALAGKATDAASELDGLIGLGEVKSQLKRLVKRMKFDKQRRNSGYSTAETHAAAVFMGSPGTAKTTVARIFGKMLREENVLSSGIFKEVARKDLVGKFVGWTAPTVASVFEEAKGGTIFIDEAYSLANEGMADGYSDEALSEIIRQMENNPDTLVIFAGYSDKMKHFIHNANPGLRSRLTNVIEFKDYGAVELCEMFMYFMSKEDYVLEDPSAAEETVRGFVSKIKALRSDNLGNGRLIRKLFKTAVGFMAEREGNDLRTLKISDLDQAADEIVRAESAVSNEAHDNRKIGF